MAFDAAQILRQTYAAGAEAAQMAQSLAREEPAPAQVQRGEINGTSFVVESDPLAELQDSMEELSFQFEEKTAKKLAERKMGPLQGMRASFIKALEAWRALMPDMPGNDALKKTMQNIREMLRSGGFWLVALLCVLYYSAIFPFQKYAVNMLQCNLSFTEVQSGSFWAGSSVTIIQYGIMLLVAAAAFTSNFVKGKGLKYGLLATAVVALVAFCYMGYMRQSAETVFAVFPLLAVGITPILGNYVDHKGKAASMLVLGSLLLIACHLTFAFVLPAFKGNAVGGIIIAYVTILVLGASFSLVPASLWPSVPKLVDAKIIGSAYALIFWIQNIGLWLFPLLIGKILDKTNPGVTDPVQYNYTAPLVMLACLGAAALVLGLVLKVVDRKQHLGLEEPNIK